MKLDVARVIDDSPISTFQIGIYVLCGACLLIDGFDVQSLGYVAPALSVDLHIARKELGPVLSAAPLGILFGSILWSILADRIGRRPVLVVSTLFFSVLTLLTARAGSLQEMRWVRFIGGFGMGAIMPNALALVGEYAPKRLRVAIMLWTANGFTIGAALGGFLAAWLLPRYGWRSVFYFGAAVPAILAVVMLIALPESMQFLVLKGRQSTKVGGWLRRIDPTIPSSSEYVILAQDRASGFPLLALFGNGLGTGTLLLWIINFMNLLNLYFLQSWLTTVATDAGIKASTAAIVASMVQVGGALGSLVLGLFVHRWGFAPVLIACSLLGCVSIAAIGQPHIALGVLFIVVLIAGFCVTGGQGTINALAATYYPTHLRSTGIGAGLGIGRVGAVIGPTLAGFLMTGWGWSARELFYAAAMPPLVSAVAMLCWGTMVQPKSQASPGNP